MQQTEQRTIPATATGTWNGAERGRVERVVETLATLRGRGESLSEVAHDARNMVTALALYCDLLAEPGVLANGFAHYAQELRLLAAASRRLVEKLVALDAHVVREVNAQSQPVADAGVGRVAAGAAGANGAAATPGTPATAIASQPGLSAGNSLWEGTLRSALAKTASAEQRRRLDLLPALPVANLADELLANRNLLAALAGASIALTIDAGSGAQGVRLTAEDLTRLMVNLVKNAAEAMPEGGRIHIGLREVETAQGAAHCLALTVEDSGPGIPEEALEKIFTSGYTTRAKPTTPSGWPQSHRGLGLAIVRSIVEGAGGRIAARNRAQGGACFTIELPVRKTGTGN